MHCRPYWQLSWPTEPSPNYLMSCNGRLGACFPGKNPPPDFQCQFWIKLACKVMHFQHPLEARQGNRCGYWTFTTYPKMWSCICSPLPEAGRGDSAEQLCAKLSSMLWIFWQGIEPTFKPCPTVCSYNQLVWSFLSILFNTLYHPGRICTSTGRGSWSVFN